MVEVTGSALWRAASAARNEARLLRAQSLARRMETRRALALTAGRLRKAEETYRGLARTCERPYRSAWSDLQWRMVDGDLDHVLVSHEGEL